MFAYNWYLSGSSLVHRKFILNKNRFVSTAEYPTNKIDVDEIAKRATLLQEKCGIFACLANGNYPTSLDVAGIINLGLIGLQHRGQEAAGIVTSTTPDAELVAHRGTGLLSQIFNEAVIKNLKGNLGIGHTRYSTSGGIDLQLAQPYVVHTSYGTLSVAHNGELVNSKKLRKKILESGVGLSTGSDSELITQCLSLPSPNEYRLQSADIIQKNKLNKSESESMSALSVDDSETKRKTSQHNLTGDPDEEILSRLLHLMSLTPLSYSLILMYKSNIYCVRDPFGNRPLTVGMLIPTPAEGPRASSENLALEGWVVSSESCSFPSVCAKIYRDVEPGEILKISKNELPRTLTIVPRPNGAELSAFCIFEYVYFARPDSLLEGQMVYGVRMKCGKQLAIEAPVNLSSPEMAFKVIVSPVPESAIPAALGFTEHSGYPYVEAFSKNRYVGRTFIQPSTRLRRLGVAKKFGPLGENLDGKIIILIEDSIVRGTTIGQLIRLLKESGALEVHIRIASPPLHYPCYMGINIPTREELIANRLNNEQLAHSLGANSLIYLSLEGLKSSVQSGIREKQEEMNQKDNKSGHCVACLTGDYPVDLKF